MVQVLAEYGFNGMAQAMELLFNECMKFERQQALGVGPYERSERLAFFNVCRTVSCETKPTTSNSINASA